MRVCALYHCGTCHVSWVGVQNHVWGVYLGIYASKHHYGKGCKSGQNVEHCLDEQVMLAVEQLVV
jgi:hypothetical protein